MESFISQFYSFPSFSSKPTTTIPPTQLNTYRKNSLFVVSVRAQMDPNEGSATIATSSESAVEALKAKEWEAEMFHNEVAATQGIKIRRRPPTGPPNHYVGPFQFRLQNEGNTPCNILEEIVWNKDQEVSQLKERKPLGLVRKAHDKAPPVRDFVGALRAANERTGLPGLIAEVKKASPSRGILRENFDPMIASEDIGRQILTHGESVHSLDQMVKPFLEPKTYKKAIFAYPDNPKSRVMMEELFDMDKLESCFGGHNKAGMNFEAYGKKMREDDKRVYGFIDSGCSTPSFLSSEANETLHSRNGSENGSSRREAVYSNFEEDDDIILIQTPCSEVKN